MTSHDGPPVVVNLPAGGFEAKAMKGRPARGYVSTSSDCSGFYFDRAGIQTLVRASLHGSGNHNIVQLWTNT